MALEKLKPSDRDWQRYSECLGKDPDIFHPRTQEQADAAKVICKNCVVREECLEYGITYWDDPATWEWIWGGKDQREVQVIIQERERSDRAQ